MGTCRLPGAFRAREGIRAMIENESKVGIADAAGDHLLEKDRTRKHVDRETEEAIVVLNPETRSLWDYPDGPWDAERNSIAFAVIIGAIFLHERLSLMRLTSITTTLIGTMVLKLSR